MVSEVTTSAQSNATPRHHRYPVLAALSNLIMWPIPTRAPTAMFPSPDGYGRCERMLVERAERLDHEPGLSEDSRPFMRVAVIVPCYRVTAHVLHVLKEIPPIVEGIFCVDDACPDKSGRLIEQTSTDPRVRVIYNEHNLGVGGAVKAGYRAAAAGGFDVAIKIDGDGQMDPHLIPRFIAAIASHSCDYAKGNRFFRIEDVRRMPKLRIFGNAILSLLSKISTGNWHIFDPTNGYTALHLATLDLLDLDKVANRYFFETDLLFRLNLARCVTRDLPMTAKYGDEISNLRISRIVLPFLWGHIRNTVKRIGYTYFLRDFHATSVTLVLGPPLLSGGVVFSLYHWWRSIHAGIPATAGTVMICALLLISGAQLLLSALAFDISNVPRDPMHLVLQSADPVQSVSPSSWQH